MEELYEVECYVNKNKSITKYIVGENLSLAVGWLESRGEIVLSATRLDGWVMREGFEQPSPEFTKTCQMCGVGFMPQRSDSKFCGDKCRMRNHRKKGEHESKPLR